MRIGVLGSGLMGAKLGTIFARAGHEVVFSYARSHDKLKKLARDPQGNARAGTPGEAAKEADALLLAVHWSRIDDVLKQARDLSGKVIVTCSLPKYAEQRFARHSMGLSEFVTSKILCGVTPLSTAQQPASK
jgi:predicted dinucleotide-binding enzyme